MQELHRTTSGAKNIMTSENQQKKNMNIFAEKKNKQLQRTLNFEKGLQTFEESSFSHEKIKRTESDGCTFFNETARQYRH